MKKPTPMRQNRIVPQTPLPTYSNALTIASEIVKADPERLKHLQAIVNSPDFQQHITLAAASFFAVLVRMGLRGTEIERVMGIGHDDALRLTTIIESYNPPPEQAPELVLPGGRKAHG